MNEVLNKALALSYIHSKLAIDNYDIAAHELNVKNKDLKSKINQLRITRFKESKIRIALLKKELSHTQEMQVFLKDMKAVFKDAFEDMEKNSTENFKSDLNLIHDKCWD